MDFCLLLHLDHRRRREGVAILRTRFDGDFFVARRRKSSGQIGDDHPFGQLKLLDILCISVQNSVQIMSTVTLTEFRSHASGMLDRVERGETLVVLRHGRPIAEVSPVAAPAAAPSWKKPALRLVAKGAALSRMILAERDDENLR